MDDASTRFTVMRVFVRETGIRVSFVINLLSFSQHFEVCFNFLWICLEICIWFKTQIGENLFNYSVFSLVHQHFLVYHIAQTRRVWNVLWVDITIFATCFCKDLIIPFLNLSWWDNVKYNPIKSHLSICTSRVADAPNWRLF